MADSISDLASSRSASASFSRPFGAGFKSFGVRDESLAAPDAIALESMLVARPGNAEVQLDLLLDDASNVAKYPDFQAYFRKHQPPLLAVRARMIPSSCPLARRLGSVTSPMPRCAFMTPATSRSKHTARKSALLSERF